jgi:tRNA dimethylallyltransferase
VGGTGLYLRALCDGLEIPPVLPDRAMRASLEALAQNDGWQSVFSILAEADPLSAQRIEGRNVRRVIRAIEVTRATGRPFSEWQGRSEPPFATRWVGLDVPVPVLNAMISRRVREQFDGGLVAEVAKLRRRGFAPNLPPLQGLAYREAAQVLDGEVHADEAVIRYASSTRHYARRQRSWFRPNKRIRWVDPRQASVDDVLGHFMRDE